MPRLLCWLTAGLLLGPGPLMGAAGEVHDLVCRELPAGTEVLRLPLDPGETFTIRYIHSVDRTPVFEIFGLDEEGCLTLRATYFKMFGAGMGHWPGRGRLEHDGRWTWIRDIHERLGSFVLRVGSPAVDHTLLYRGREIRLSPVWAGKRLRVAVETGAVVPERCSKPHGRFVPP